MSDLDVAQATDTQAPATTIIRVPVTKSKDFVEINTDDIPDDVYREIILQGLKVLVNRGMSKITKSSTKDEAELKALAQAQAEKNVTAIKESKIKFSAGSKAKKASGAVMTEARRLARNLIKDEMKRQGIKISHVEASEITKAANALLDEDPSIVEQAKANLAEREKVDVGAKINLKSLIKTSPELVAKAEARKAKAKKDAPLSAKQAGMTAKSKPKGAQPQA